jgi:hypothetical protein
LAFCCSLTTKIEEPDGKVSRRIFGAAEEKQQGDKKYCMIICVIHII